MKRSDRALGLGRDISRRDFLNGARIALTGNLLGSTMLEALAADTTAAIYPPALTGMRGSHAGSFEVAHSLRDGNSWDAVGDEAWTGETYDLVVVGGGLSGLAAAWAFRQAAGTDARILVLDNHDDFGGHAKRNEFTHAGRLLIGYGGTEQIYPGPSAFSEPAIGMLRAIGVDTDRFYSAFDQDLYRQAGLSRGVFFDKETFGADRLVVGEGERPWPDFLHDAPLPETARRDIAMLYDDPPDFMPGLSVADKEARLDAISYNEFLTDVAGVHPLVPAYFHTRTLRLYGVGTDAVTALRARRGGYPGFDGMQLSELKPYFAAHEPHDIFHFPDGNASIARLLVRAMIPAALPGEDMEDVVTARLEYEQLDDPGSPVRIRLNSTAVRVRHRGASGDSGEIDVTYVSDGRTHKVRAGKCVLACYNAIIPALCPELPGSQKAGLANAVRSPFVYTNVLIRNWKAWQALGVHHIFATAGYHTEVKLDFPVSLGNYRHSRSPDEPIVLHMERAPHKAGLPRHEQKLAGRRELLETSFETCERNIRQQLNRLLADGGFDAARDVLGITVNRWPHGYANWEVLPDWAGAEPPWVIGRQRFGNIAIANSDAGASALTQAAIDQAFRAVDELLT